MKIHLIRSEGYPIEDFNNVLNLLNKYRGSIEYIPAELIVLPVSEVEVIFEDLKSFEKKEDFLVEQYNKSMAFPSESMTFPHHEEVLTWEQLFSVCIQFRNEKLIDPKDHVILLTNIANDLNWFGGVDPSLKNYFIHTNNWDLYFGNNIDGRFPIAYQIASWLIKTMMYTTQLEILSNSHLIPRGCMMDFCKDKTQIILKMRTGDLCESCMKVLSDRDVNRTHVRQLFSVMDGLRENILFRQRSSLLMEQSRMEIRGQNKAIYLCDLGDLQVNLNPKEKALYLLYLNHPEGISRSYLVDHWSELRNYYGILANQPTNALIDEAINRLTDVTDNNMNEVMARIRTKFRQAVGEEQSKVYSIESTPEGKHKICLNRELVRYVD